MKWDQVGQVLYTAQQKFSMDLKIISRFESIWNILFGVNQQVWGS